MIERERERESEREGEIETDRVRERESSLFRDLSRACYRKGSTFFR